MKIGKIIIIMAALSTAVQVGAESNDVSGKDKIKYLGDLVIRAGEMVEGDVVVMQGDLRVAGVVNGDAVISFGNAYIDSGAIINGDVVALRGKITVDENAKVTGQVVEKRLFDISMDDDDDEFRGDRSFSIRADCDDEHKDSKCGDEADVDARIGYNKVDGFFLGVKVPKAIGSRIETFPKIAVHGFFGYSFANDHWQYNGELDKWFFEENRLEFGVEAHDFTDTDDDWIIDDEENSLAAFFLHEDFRDYFYRRGFGAHISQEVGEMMRLKVKYLADDYDTAVNEASWALFGGNKEFVPNYDFMGLDANVWPGMMRSILTTADMKLFYSDLLLSGSVEYSNPDDLGGNFDFTRYIFEMKGYFDLSRCEAFDFRLKLGASDGDLPPQKTFVLGGISTLRGFKHKEYFGQQMALLNVEYRLFSRSKPSHWWITKLFQLGLFADVGSVEQDIFKNFDTADYKSNVGVAFMGDEGDFRIDLARRTDTGEKPWVLTFRIKQAF